jgi:hypothetical protein
MPIRRFGMMKEAIPENRRILNLGYPCSNKADAFPASHPFSTSSFRESFNISDSRVFLIRPPEIDPS